MSDYELISSKGCGPIARVANTNWSTWLGAAARA